MFCTNCNTQIPDGSQFCVNCGKSLDVTVMPGRSGSYTPSPAPAQAPVQPAQTPVQQFQTPVQPVQPQQQAPNYYNQQPVYPVQQAPKKSKKGLIIGLVIALLVVALGVGGFLFYWFTRPIYKITKALEAEDYETVIDLYPSLDKEEDQTMVIDEILASENTESIINLFPLVSEDQQEPLTDYLLSYAKSLRNDYKDETLSFDEVDEELTRLDNEIFTDNDDFDEIVDEVENLYNSREDFKTAEEYFAAEMYEEAMEYYGYVITEDSNYDKAQARIEECLSYLIPDLTGTWYTTLDLSKTMDKELKADGLRCHIEMDFNFYSDKTGVINMNSNSVYDAYDELVDSIEDVIREEFEAACDYDTSIDYDELMQQYFEDEGYFSAEDYIAGEIVSFSSFSDYVLANTLEYTYEVTQETFVLTYTNGSTEEFEYVLDGDVLTILSYDTQSSADSSLGFNPPVDLKKG